MAKLYGVGVGPGDKDLITLKSAKILEIADIVVAPASTGDESIAYEIAKTYIKGNVVFMEFPMVHSKEQLERKWDENVKKIKKMLDEGNNVAFITIGDPMVYSTYIYVLKRMKDYDVETIPGITSFNAAAARLNVPIAEGKESFAVIPSGDLDDISNALDMYNNVILMKVSRKYDDIVGLLNKKNFKGMLVIRCGHEDEEVIYNLDKHKNKKINYLSLIIAKKVMQK